MTTNPFLRRIRAVSAGRGLQWFPEQSGLRAPRVRWSFDHADEECAPNFENFGFNDRVDAAIVRRAVWRLCTDARMQGNCRDFGPGRYNDLGPLDGKVSSAAFVGR